MMFHEEMLDLLEAAIEAKWLGEVSVSRDALRPDTLVVEWPEGDEAEVRVRSIDPSTVVDIDATVERHVIHPDYERDVKNITESIADHLGIDPEVAKAREEIDAAVPAGRWSYEFVGSGQQEYVVDPEGKRYLVYMGVGRVLAEQINRLMLASNDA